MSALENILINPFLRATKGSVKRAEQLGSYTYTALKGHSEPDIQAILADYEPVWIDFMEKLGYKGTDYGQKKGNTAALQQGLRRLAQTHIKEWALAIEYVHRRGTPEYIALLPHGRRPFRSGKDWLRIETVTVLAGQLAGDPQLAALHAQVAQANEELQSLFAAAQRAGGKHSLDAGSLRNARITLCTALYVVLARLIALYPAKPERVRAFFDIGTMHRHYHRKRKAMANEGAEVPQNNAAGEAGA